MLCSSLSALYTLNALYVPSAFFFQTPGSAVLMVFLPFLWFLFFLFLLASGLSYVCVLIAFAGWLVDIVRNTPPAGELTYSLDNTTRCCPYFSPIYMTRIILPVL